MNLLDGAVLPKDGEKTADFVIVGSGPAGSAVARAVARAGASVLVVEEGPLRKPSDFHADSFQAMADLYRDLGGSLTRGPAPMPYLQGRVVGGTSVINGAISWRLPKDIHDQWCKADPALTLALPFDTLEALTDEMERELGIAPTDPAIAGTHNALFAKGAQALGIAHRPISRNVVQCQGSGGCLQGCRHGRKQSMDLTRLPQACEYGAEIMFNTKVLRIDHDHRRARGVLARSQGGGLWRLQARRAVVLAASAVQTPCLLWQSGLRHGPVGEGFQGHPGASAAGFFREPVHLWQGATQGHEGIGLRQEGLKFEVLGMDIGVAMTRLPGVGQELSRHLALLPHMAEWGCAVKAQARGTVRPSLLGRPVVRYQLTDADMAKTRKGLSILAQMLLAAGAERVHLGVHGGPTEITDPRQAQAFASEGPRDPRAYAMVLTHLFGTAAMGSDPARSVVGPDFGVHQLAQLYVADSSVFPSNTGVNPQTSILALASLCGQRLAAAG